MSGRGLLLASPAHVQRTALDQAQTPQRFKAVRSAQGMRHIQHETCSYIVRSMLWRSPGRQAQPHPYACTRTSTSLHTPFPTPTPLTPTPTPTPTATATPTTTVHTHLLLLLRNVAAQLLRLLLTVGCGHDQEGRCLLRRCILAHGPRAAEQACSVVPTCVQMHIHVCACVCVCVCVCVCACALRECSACHGPCSPPLVPVYMLRCGCWCGCVCVPEIIMRMCVCVCVCACARACAYQCTTMHARLFAVQPHRAPQTCAQQRDAVCLHILAADRLPRLAAQQALHVFKAGPGWVIFGQALNLHLWPGVQAPCTAQAPSAILPTFLCWWPSFHQC